MIITCTHCQKEYNIPDERLSAYKKNIVFPCPACKENIEVVLDVKENAAGNLSAETKTVQETPPANAASSKMPSGQALKEKILRSVKDLPPMPQVAYKAREVIADSKSSFTDLAEVIKTDQAIVTRVLKLANSAYYGVSGKVSSVQHASVVLGMKTLMELLTLACASSSLSKTLKGYNLEAGDLWKHSLAVAFGSQVIANKKKPDLAQDAFSAGLIHDVGKIILDRHVLDRKETFEAFVQDGKESFLQAEKTILGFDHSQIASEVCERWRIPQQLSTAIKYHHSPSRSNGNELAYIVHVADMIAIMSGIGDRKSVV